MSGKSYTEEEIEATLSKSEQLLAFSESLSKTGKALFEKLGMPRGTSRRLINHPLASEELKAVGNSQIQRWQGELSLAMAGTEPKKVATRRRSLIAL